MECCHPAQKGSGAAEQMARGEIDERSSLALRRQRTVAEAGGGFVDAVNGAAPVRAFLIASVRAYREPFARALRSAGTDVVGTAADPVSALPLIGELEPDAILVEALTPDQRLSIPGLRAVVAETPIVALGIPDRPVDAIALVEAGASGYVTMDQSVDEAASVVRSVVHGEFPCSGRVGGSSRIASPSSPLWRAHSSLRRSGSPRASTRSRSFSAPACRTRRSPTSWASSWPR